MTPLHENIQNLKAEIKSLNLDTEHQAKLDELVNQLEAEPQGVSLDIPHLIERFEAEHPALTNTLNQIMVTLSNMGI